MTDHTTPAIGVSFTEQLGETSQVVFQTHVAQDVSKHELDRLLDRFALAARRQRAAQSLPALQERLTELTTAFARGNEDLAALDARQQGEPGRRNPKLNPAQQVDREKAVASISRWKQDGEKVKARIAEYEALIGETSAPDRSADRH